LEDVDLEIDAPKDMKTSIWRSTLLKTSRLVAPLPP
jgi:hypothetical protein